jgi:type I restriction enzyme S subunit
MSDDVPEGWDSVRLDDCLDDFRNGWTYDTRAVGGTLPITRIETIADGTINYKRIGLAQPDPRIEAFRLRKHDILFSHINSVEHIAKVAMMRDDELLYHGMNLMRLRPSNRVIPEFLLARLRSNATRTHFRAACKRAVNQASLNKGEIGGYRFLLPPIDEQRRIAEVLQSVDQAIDGVSATIRQANIVHTGLLDSLIDTGTKAGQGNWKQSRLGDLVADPITYGIVQPGDYLDEGVTLVRGGDFPDGQIEVETLPRISPDIASPYHRSMLKGGEILISLVGYPGACAIVPEKLTGANISRSAALVRPGPDVDGNFLYHFIRSPLGQRRILLNSIGSAQQVVNLKDLREVFVPLPSRERQKEIASVMNGSMRQILLATENLAHLKNLSASISSDLLSGHVRVPA